MQTISIYKENGVSDYYYSRAYTFDKDSMVFINVSQSIFGFRQRVDVYLNNINIFNQVLPANTENQSRFFIKGGAEIIFAQKGDVIRANGRGICSITVIPFK